MQIQSPPHSRRNRSGFTLIELLLVVVIIGVLATIAIPKFSEVRTRAIASAARSDLRNLLIAQDSHYDDHHTFTADLPALGIIPSNGVTITVIAPTPTGWSATASYRNGQCAIYYGSAAPLAPATISTVVACT